jgi:DNA-binding transcriptional ArsR family regulator
LKALLTILSTNKFLDAPNKVIKLLEKEGRLGLSITDLVSNSKLSRSAIRIILAKMEGARMVKFRRVGMAKLYYLEDET